MLESFIIMTMRGGETRTLPLPRIADPRLIAKGYGALLFETTRPDSQPTQKISESRDWEVFSSDPLDRRVPVMSEQVQDRAAHKLFGIRPVMLPTQEN
ncbi:MAG: hypothetical protein JWN34_2350 [Bryobacterales bacterium]|nr:hypothetical protein [Bryobacterales bacterium]